MASSVHVSKYFLAAFSLGFQLQGSASASEDTLPRGYVPQHFWLSSFVSVSLLPFRLFGENEEYLNFNSKSPISNFVSQPRFSVVWLDFRLS